MDQETEGLAALAAALRAALRRFKRSSRTEEAYRHWFWRFVRFQGEKDVRRLGSEEVMAFFDALASGRLSSSSFNQALSAITFFYRKVLGFEMPGRERLERPTIPDRLPEVVSYGEVQQLIARLRPPFRLMAELLYGSGLHVMECVRLRVGDVDFDQNRLRVTPIDGGEERWALLPRSVRASLAVQIQQVVGAQRQGPQFVFPASRLTRDQASGSLVRTHIHDTALQRAIKEAATAAGLVHRVTGQTLRHSFAVHLLEKGVDIRTVQTLVGHKDIRSTLVYMRVVAQGPAGVVSPLDR